MSGASDGHRQPTSYGTSGWSALSSKAKGKQRAANQDDPENQSSSLGGLEVGIRFTDGVTEDLVIFVNASEPAREVKRRIRLLRPTLATNRLRLIYLGRIITDGTRLVPWLNELLQRQQEQEENANAELGLNFAAIGGAVKQALSDDTAPRLADLGRKVSSDGSADDNCKRLGRNRSDSGHQTKLRITWIHCSVGEPGSNVEETEATAAARQQTNEQQQRLAGFDRLREAGFSEEEIENMRAEFHADGPRDTAVVADDDEHARALEEQWMSGLGAGGSDPNPNSGDFVTLFKGVVAGFFLPFLPLFFFRPEMSTFSKRMQLAIVAGVTINVVYGALRAFA